MKNDLAQLTFSYSVTMGRTDHLAAKVLICNTVLTLVILHTFNMNIILYTSSLWEKKENFYCDFWVIKKWLRLVLDKTMFYNKPSQAFCKQKFKLEKMQSVFTRNTIHVIIIHLEFCLEI